MHNRNPNRQERRYCSKYGKLTDKERMRVHPERKADAYEVKPYEYEM